MSDDVDIHHEVSVKRLRELLSELKDDDLLVPNMVGNLAIVREAEWAGYIDLLNGQQHVELYDKGEVR